VPIFLGIDGGGTKTVCALGDGTRVLAMGEAGGSNIVRSGEPQARSSIHEAIRNACAAAELKESAIESACIGVAGAGRPEISDMVQRVTAEVLPCRVQVTGDMVIALAAAFGKGPGVIVIAGTGSIAYGRNSTGETARAGGWGFAISDEGSGQWIGRTAISRVLRLHDAGKESALASAILSDWQASSFDELVRAANAVPPPDFSRLFPVVLAAADAGEITAREVLSDAGAELARLAKLVVERISPGEEATVPAAMAGGIFRQSALVRQSFYTGIRAAFPAIAVNPTVAEPVLGALELAKNFLTIATDSGESPQMP
jgi:glucosamine kinase